MTYILYCQLQIRHHCRTLPPRHTEEEADLFGEASFVISNFFGQAACLISFFVDPKPGLLLSFSYLPALEVRLGEYEVTDANRPDCVGGGDNFCLEDPQDFDIAPEDVVLHPDYGKDRQRKLTNTINDIALIRLPSLAKENLAVRVVCLPILPKVAAEQLNVPDLGIGLTSFYPTVVGWGHTEVVFNCSLFLCSLNEYQYRGPDMNEEDHLTN